MERFAKNVIQLVVLVQVGQTRSAMIVSILSRKEVIKLVKYVHKLVSILILLLKFVMSA